MTFCLCLEWWGQAGPSHYHVHTVLPRMQCVWWGGWWGVWDGQQHWKRQQLWLFEPSTKSQVKVSHDNIWELNENTWREFSSCFIIGAYISHPTCTSYYANLTTLPYLLFRLRFPGKSSLRTMGKGRMWILLPAAPALKRTPEQMASQIWVPPCLQG